jgi:hypothetical protein
VHHTIMPSQTLEMGGRMDLPLRDWRNYLLTSNSAKPS